MTSLREALKKKYGSPREALRALGIDERILDKRADIVGDAKMETTMAKIKPTKLPLTRKGTLAHGAISVFLQPRLAQDAKLDLVPLLKDVRRKTFAQDKAALLAKIAEAVKGKLGKDASIDGLASVLDMIEAHEPESQDAEPEEERQPGVDEPPPWLKGKLSDDEYAHVMDWYGKGRDGLTGEKPGRDAEPDKPGGPGTPKVGGEDEDDDDDNKKEPAVDRKAMDAAIKAASKKTEERVLKSQREVREAEKYVRPWVGELNIAFDSADQVYKTTLDSLGVKTDGVHSSAFRAILDQCPQPGKERRERPNIAQDGKDSESFFKMFPGAERIGQL